MTNRISIIALTCAIFFTNSYAELPIQITPAKNQVDLVVDNSIQDDRGFPGTARATFWGTIATCLLTLRGGKVGNSNLRNNSIA
jgi:hypothetical protein